MDIREIITQTVTDAPEVTELIEDRFDQSTAVDTAPAKKPFATYTMGPESVAGPYPIGARERTFQLWAHTTPGDYGPIDQVLDAAREALLAKQPRPGFLEFRWIERSQDLYDPALGTICRYDRWMATGF